ncbi:MAG: glycine cleavage system protein T [Actinobacteria bacterium]|nr:glycine cleavage system protein T [Actinomycetota bacterium]
MTNLRLSPLDGDHRALGAKMVEFGGWDMPVAYPTGTINEHLACRRGAVVFDVSHLGTVRVEGYYAKAALQGVLTNDLNKISVGRAQYTHLLNDAGCVLDDIIVWWVSDDRFDVMPNASNTDHVLSALGGVDVTQSRAVLAVQGPRAKELLATISDAQCVVAGTGYTGEQGVEIAVPVSHAIDLWHAILGAGVIPAGLGARDTLRLEAGLPLHGHELSPLINPLEANLDWVISWNKKTFAGRDALLKQREIGVSRHLIGITTVGRRPPRDGCDVLVGETIVGRTTSGNFSPVLEHGIAIALVNSQLAIGSAVAIDVRGSRLDGVVVKLPFIAKK